MLTNRAWQRPIYYGWMMLVAVSLGQITSWGVLFSSFAVFLTPMQEECHFHCRKRGRSR